MTCGEELPPPLPSAPCSDLVTRLQEATPVSWGFTTHECPATSYEVTQAPSERTAPASLISLFGSERELTFCGGDALVAELGWPRLVAGASRAALRYEAGQYVVYGGCTEADAMVTLEGGRLMVEVGAAALVVSSDLQLRTADPSSVHATAAAIPGYCNAHVVAAATPGELEVCVSTYQGGAPGQVLYASFRTECD